MITSGLSAWLPNDTQQDDDLFGVRRWPNIMHGPKTQLESLLHDEEDAGTRLGAFMDSAVTQMQGGYNAIISQINQDLYNGNYKT